MSFSFTFLSSTFPSKLPISVYSNLIIDTLSTDKNTIVLHFIQKKPGHYRCVGYNSHVMIHTSIPPSLFSEKNKAPWMIFPFCLNSCHTKTHLYCAFIADDGAIKIITSCLNGEVFSITSTFTLEVLQDYNKIFFLHIAYAYKA